MKNTEEINEIALTKIEVIKKKMLKASKEELLVLKEQQSFWYDKTNEGWSKYTAQFKSVVTL